jgi:hypothetical protein
LARAAHISAGAVAFALVGLTLAPTTNAAGEGGSCDPSTELCLMTAAPWVAPQYLTYEGPAGEAQAFTFRWTQGAHHDVVEPATVIGADSQHVTWQVRLPAVLAEGSVRLRATATSPALESITDGTVRRAAAHPAVAVHHPASRYVATLSYQARAPVHAAVQLRLRAHYIAGAWHTIRTWRRAVSGTRLGSRRLSVTAGAKTVARTCAQFFKCELQARGRLSALGSTLADLSARRRVPTSRERPTGRSVFLPGSTPVSGRGKRYRYALFVEGGLRVDRREFARQVHDTLFDSRSWGRTGRRGFQQVASRARANTKIILAGPRMVDRLCAPLSTRGYVSCTRGAMVILNVNRWRYAVPHWPLSRLDYRHMLINHEVGHRLGQHHRRCGGRGQLAPVMQQQTYGLHGCRANPWPLSYEVSSLARSASAAMRRGDHPSEPGPRSWVE